MFKIKKTKNKEIANSKKNTKNFIDFNTCNSLFEFDEFMSILETWLQKQASNENQEEDEEEQQQDQENLEEVSAIEKKGNNQDIEDFSHRENPLVSSTDIKYHLFYKICLGVERYQKLLQKTLDENRETFEELFREKLGENEEEKLTFEDFVNFVKECLERGEVYLKYKNTEENPEDPLDFENNKSAFFDVAEKFFVLEKGVGKAFFFN